MGTFYFTFTRQQMLQKKLHDLTLSEKTKCFGSPSSSQWGLVEQDFTRVSAHALHTIQWKHQLYFVKILLLLLCKNL